MRENEDMKKTIEEIEDQRKIWMDEIRGLFGESTGQQKLFQEFEEINGRLHASQEQLRSEIGAVSKERDQLRQTAINAVKRNEQLEEQLQRLQDHTSQMRKDFEYDSMQLRQELESQFIRSYSTEITMFRRYCRLFKRAAKRPENRAWSCPAAK